LRPHFRCAPRQSFILRATSALQDNHWTALPQQRTHQADRRESPLQTEKSEEEEKIAGVCCVKGKLKSK